MITWSFVAITFVVFGFLFGAVLAYALCKAAKIGDEKSEALIKIMNGE